jgi:hypothetical protein
VFSEHKLLRLFEASFSATRMNIDVLFLALFFDSDMAS